jgi:hypothetical protein
MFEKKDDPFLGKYDPFLGKNDTLFQQQSDIMIPWIFREAQKCAFSVGAVYCAYHWHRRRLQR